MNSALAAVPAVAGIVGANAPTGSVVSWNSAFTERFYQTNPGNPYGNAGDDVIFVNAAAGTQSHLIGTTGANTLVAGAGDDLLWAHEGNDVLDGGAGNDTLKGSPGTMRTLSGAAAGRTPVLRGALG